MLDLGGKVNMVLSCFMVKDVLDKLIVVVNNNNNDCKCFYIFFMNILVF